MRSTTSVLCCSSSLALLFHTPATRSIKVTNPGLPSAAQSESAQTDRYGKEEPLTSVVRWEVSAA
jgi:hypothetical protein